MNQGETHVIMGPNGAGKSTLGLTVMGHPKYEVKKVEQVYCKNDITVCAKYTLQNWHIKKKNDIEMQELYLEMYLKTIKMNLG